MVRIAVCTILIVVGFFFALPYMVLTVEKITTEAKLKRSGEVIEAGFYKRYEPSEGDRSLAFLGVVMVLGTLVYIILKVWG